MESSNQQNLQTHSNVLELLENTRERVTEIGLARGGHRGCLILVELRLPRKEFLLWASQRPRNHGKMLGLSLACLSMLSLQSVLQKRKNPGQVWRWSCIEDLGESSHFSVEFLTSWDWSRWPVWLGMSHTAEHEKFCLLFQKPTFSFYCSFVILLASIYFCSEPSYFSPPANLQFGLFF